MPIILSQNKQKKIKSIKKQMIDLDLTNGDVAIYLSVNNDYVTRILNCNSYVSMEKLDEVLDSLDVIASKKYKRVRV